MIFPQTRVEQLAWSPILRHRIAMLALELSPPFHPRWPLHPRTEKTLYHLVNYSPQMRITRFIHKILLLLFPK